MIESLDPITLPLFAVALYAAAMYPLGAMLGSSCSSCCGCPKCTGCNCCGEDYSKPTGFCCEGEWRLSGSCCGGEFRTTEEEEGGECCDDNWYTTGGGTCCKVPTVPLAFSSTFGGVEACNALARGKIILTDGRTTIAAVLQHGGSGYARVVDEVVEVATVTIISLNNLSGTYATLSATIDDDPESETFGQITALTIDNPGGGYVHWFAPPQDHYFPDSEEGECCGNDWRTGEGTCCNKVWYPADDECPEGKVFVTKSATCCGCVADEVYDPEAEEMVPTLDNLGLVDCPLCGVESFPYAKFDEFEADRGPMGRCCLPGGVCNYTFEDDCEGTWEDKCCLASPRCLTTCCREDDDGVASCEIVPIDECGLPSNEPNCDTACKGACCVDGESIGMTTQAECDDADGCWAGVGEEECRATDECRPPFTTNCCESVVSDASGLTFTQPRRKRCEPTASPWLVTVTGTTDSEILIHGVPVGQTATPTARCPINVAFLVCWDKFNIEPMPCNSNFRRLDVTVCWTPSEDVVEVVRYSGCNDIALWLGDCTRNCETTLTYDGPGVTSTINVELRGNATIEANGTGALAFPNGFSYDVGCNITLTLTGTSTADNSVGLISQQLESLTSLVKTGTGRWRLTAASNYGGTSTIKDGTISVGVNTTPTSGAFGTTNNLVTLGDASAGEQTALLLESGITFGKWILVPATAAGRVVLGGEDGSGFNDSSMFVYLGSDITLQAASGGVVEFRNRWTNGDGTGPPDADVTVGTSDNTGEVLLVNNLRTTGTVTVAFGTLHVSGVSGRFQNAEEVIVSGAAAELRYDSDFDMERPLSLTAGTLSGDATINTVAASGGTISVDSGDEILIDSEFSGSGTLQKTGGGTLRLTAANTFSGTLNVSAGTVVTETIPTNPGELAASATFTNTTLSVAFSDDPTTGAQYVLLAGPTTQTYTGAVTLTGTSKTGTYNAATATLTIT
jgi:autotransporter-associated beta strand protein